MRDAYHFRDIARVVREASDVAAGVTSLRAIASRDLPPSLPVWKVVDTLDWPADVPVAAAAWRDRAATCIPPDTTGIYLGLDGLNMPNGKGIELGCSTAHEPGRDAIDFIYHCGTYCDELPMPSLTTFYTWFYGQQGWSTFGDDNDRLCIECPICLGATALVMRDALRSLDAPTLHGTAAERCYALGFHDGDMMRLGRAAVATGFVCDAEF